MTPRERFLSAFAHREADRVPVFDVVNNPALYVRRFGTDNKFGDGSMIAELYRGLGLDACFVPVGGYTGLIHRRQNWISENGFIDEFGVEYAVNGSSWPLAIPVVPSITGRPAWEALKRPDPSSEWRFEELKKAQRAARSGGRDEIAVIAGIRSSFSVMLISMGMENLAAGLYDDPSLIEEMSEALCGFWTEAGTRAVEAGADALYIANDLGLNTGTIIAPDHLRSYFFPPFIKQVRALKKTGAKVILHTCGNVNAVLPDIAASGVDGLNNLQRTAGMDIKAVKETYGKEMTLLGNVDSTNVMTSKEPGIIDAAVREVIGEAAADGGFVLATDHSFHMGIPTENVDVFLSAARRWGARGRGTCSSAG